MNRLIIQLFVAVLAIAAFTMILAAGFLWNWDADEKYPPVPEQAPVEKIDAPELEEPVPVLREPQAVVEAPAPAAPTIEAPDHSPMILELYGLVNAERTTPLVENPVLSARAYERAAYLCEQDQWSHDGWEASFVGFTGYMGENLASGFSDAQAAHQALMSSPTHRANIVHPGYTAIGMGEACGIVVELFN